jgi:hypothetical protein
MFKQLFLGLSLLFWAYPSLAQPTYTPEDVEQGKKYQAEALANVKAFKSNLDPSHYQDLPADQWMDGVKSAHFFLKNYFVPNKKEKILHTSHKLFIYLLDLVEKKNELISYESINFSLKNRIICMINFSTSEPAYKVLKSKYPKINLMYSTTNSDFDFGGGEVWLSRMYFKVSYLKFFGSKNKTAYVLADKIVIKHEDFWLVASFVPQDNWDTDALQREIDAQQAEMDKEIAFLKPLAQARSEKEGAIVKARDAEKAAAREAKEREIYAYKNKSWPERAAYSADDDPIVSYRLRDRNEQIFLIKDLAGDYLLYRKEGDKRVCIAYFKYTQERYEGYTLDGKFLGAFASSDGKAASFGPERKPHWRVRLNSSGMARLYPENQLDDRKYIGKVSDDFVVSVFDREVYMVNTTREPHLHFLYYIFFMQ